MLEAGGVAVAGVAPRPVEEARNQWLPYIAVDDVGAYTEKALGLGGELVWGPTTQGDGSVIAVMKGASGALFVMYQGAR